MSKRENVLAVADRYDPRPKVHSFVRLESSLRKSFGSRIYINRSSQPKNFPSEHVERARKCLFGCERSYDITQVQERIPDLFGLQIMNNGKCQFFIREQHGRDLFIHLLFVFFDFIKKRLR